MLNYSLYKFVQNGLPTLTLRVPGNGDFKIAADNFYAALSNDSDNSVFTRFLRVNESATLVEDTGVAAHNTHRFVLNSDNVLVVFIEDADVGRVTEYTGHLVEFIREFGDNPGAVSVDGRLLAVGALMSDVHVALLEVVHLHEHNMPAKALEQLSKVENLVRPIPADKPGNVLRAMLAYARARLADGQGALAVGIIKQFCANQ